MSKEEIVKALRDLANRNETLSNDPELSEICRKVFEKNNIEGFDPANPGEMAKILAGTEIEIPIEEEIVTEEVKLETRALNSQDLKILLEDFDEHRDLKDAGKIAEAIQKNPLLKRISSKDILKVIIRKIELEKKQLEKYQDPKIADKVSDEVIVVEAKIRESKAVLSDENIEVLAEKIVTIATEKASLEESRAEIGRELKSEKITEEKFTDEVIGITEDVTAEKIVEDKTEKIIVAATEEIARVMQAGTEKKKEIEEAVRARVTAVIREPSESLNDYRAKIVTAEGKIETSRGNNLTEEVLVIAGQKDGKEGEVARIIKGADLRIKEIAVQNPEAFDLVRGNQLETEVFEEAIGTESTENARETAKFVRQISFPRGQVTTTSELDASEVMEANGYQGGEKRTAVDQAGVIGKLIKSPIRITENVERIMRLNPKLDKIPAVQKLKSVATILKSNPKLAKSLEYVQGLVNFQNKIGKVVGGIANPIGYVLKNPAVQQFAIQVATKLGGQTLGAMATQIASLGLEKGMETIIGQILTKGTVAAVKAGATKIVGSTAVNAILKVAGTAFGVSNPIGWIMLGASLIIDLGRALIGKIYGGARDFFGKILETLGIGSAETIEKAKDFLKSAASLGGKAILGITAAIIAIPALFASGVFTAISTVMVVVLAGLVGYNLFQTASTQVSSLVAPPIVEGGGVCVNTGKPEGGSGGAINCDQSVPDQSGGTTVDKQNFVRVAEAWRAGGGENAEKCFNDVVKRANDAGINADYALWAWLHESGASNYTAFKNVSDFGVIYVAANNFTEQITAFLKLDMGKACPQLDYWLSFATNYYTGGCDPDLVIDGVSGRMYKAELEATWEWITNSPMPSDIHTSSGGNGGTSPGPKLETITEVDGSVVVCEILQNSTGSNPGNVALPTLDPNMEIPEGCPALRPVSGGYITQGPYGQGCSHANMPNAVDFGVADGTTIMATHDGIARVGANAVYGNFVDITGICNGVEFTTRYAHMPDGGASVGNNTVVKAGQKIGVVNNTGSSSGSHLHYDFRNIGSGGNLPNISASIGAKVDLTGCCIDGPTACPN